MKILLYISMFFIVSCKAPSKLTSIPQAEGLLMYPTIKPNFIYHTTMVTDVNSTLEYIGDEGMVEQLKPSGSEYPIVSNKITEIATTMETGKVDETGSFSIYSVYDSLRESSNGSMDEQNNSNGILKQFEGVEAFGNIDAEMQMSIDSIVGLENELLRPYIEQGMKGVLNRIEYPKDYVQIGDTFIINTPFAIPVFAGNVMDVVVHDTYLLDSIHNQIGYFSIDQVITMSVENESSEVVLHGQGSGNVEYDMINQVNLFYYTELEMNTSIDLGELAAKSKAITKSTVKINLEKK